METPQLAGNERSDHVREPESVALAVCHGELLYALAMMREEGPRNAVRLCAYVNVQRSVSAAMYVIREGRSAIIISVFDS